MVWTQRMEGSSGMDLEGGDGELGCQVASPSPAVGTGLALSTVAVALVVGVAVGG
jgi:hypothetical protein